MSNRVEAIRRRAWADELETREQQPVQLAKPPEPVVLAVDMKVVAEAIRQQGEALKKAFQESIAGLAAKLQQQPAPPPVDLSALIAAIGKIKLELPERKPLKLKLETSDDGKTKTISHEG